MIDDYEALFDSKFLRWFDIDGKGDVVCTIEKVEREELTLRGGAKKKSPVVTIKNGSKPFVLNRTNADAIAEIHGNKPSQWVGKRICLYVTQTKLKGKTVNCIRVKAVQEKAREAKHGEAISSHSKRQAGNGRAFGNTR